MAEVIVYTVSPCPYCDMAKQLLAKRNISFREVLVSREDSATREELFLRSKMKTFPQIFHGDRLIGGYSDLEKLDANDGLASLSSA